MTGKPHLDQFILLIYRLGEAKKDQEARELVRLSDKMLRGETLTPDEQNQIAFANSMEFLFETKQPEAFRVKLHPYQRQALTWMLWRENAQAVTNFQHPLYTSATTSLSLLVLIH